MNIFTIFCSTILFSLLYMCIPIMNPIIVGTEKIPMQVKHLLVTSAFVSSLLSGRLEYQIISKNAITIVIADTNTPTFRAMAKIPCPAEVAFESMTPYIPASSAPPNLALYVPSTVRILLKSNFISSFLFRNISHIFMLKCSAW